MKHLIYLIAGFMFLSAFASAGEIELVNCDRFGAVLQWNLDSYQILTAGDYSIVEFPGGSGIYAVGKPNIPSQQVFLEIPVDARPMVRFGDVVIRTDMVDKPIVPTQEPETDTIGEEKLARVFMMDEETYKSSDLFPANPVEIAYQGTMRGRKLVLLRVNPIQYVPSTGKLVIHEKMSIHLDFVGAARTLAETDNAMDPIASAMVLNYQPGTAEYRSGVDYLIITVSALESHANKFAEWKKQKGLSTKVEVMARDASEAAVKDTIKKYYPQVKYVLILADHHLIQLPMSARHPLGDERCQLLGIEDGNIPSDNYYACVEGTDYYPDVYVGRVPAGTAAEADLLLKKLTDYQQSPPKGDWSKRFLLCGEFQYQGGKTNMAERLFCETAFCIWHSLGKKYIFPTKTIGTGSSGLGHSEYFFRRAQNPSDPTKPGTYRAKIRDNNPPVVDCKMPAEWTTNIVSDSVARTNTLAFWNEGCFWVQHRDHGGNTNWGKPSLSKTDVANLKNGNKLPILFSVNCLTGSMDYSSDCFVEAALKNPNGGAAAAIGSTRVSYSWWNDRLCDGFYTCVYGTENYDCFDVGVKLPTQHPFSKKLGVVLNFGKMYLALNYPSNPFGPGTDYTEIEFYLFHCIGDPEMEIWTEPLTELAVKYDRTKSALKVHTFDRSTRKPVGNATVSLYNGDVQIVGHTDAEGICTIPATYAPGKYTVTVTGENLYTYQETAEIE